MEPLVSTLDKDPILALALQDGLVPIVKLELPMSVLIIFVSMVAPVRVLESITIPVSVLLASMVFIVNCKPKLAQTILAKMKPIAKIPLKVTNAGANQDSPE